MNPTIATIESASLLAKRIDQLRKEDTTGNRVRVGIHAIGFLGSAATHFQNAPTKTKGSGFSFSDGKPKAEAPIPADVENGLGLTVAAVNIASIALPKKDFSQPLKIVSTARLAANLYTAVKTIEQNQNPWK